MEKNMLEAAVIVLVSLVFFVVVFTLFETYFRRPNQTMTTRELALLSLSHL
jgi:positive regulator of sigma E activity